MKSVLAQGILVPDPLRMAASSPRCIASFDNDEALHQSGSRAQIIERYAKEQGLAFDSMSVDMRSGAHKRAPFTDVNPFGKMPAIQTADGTPVFESRAILL